MTKDGDDASLGGSARVRAWAHHRAAESVLGPVLSALSDAGVAVLGVKGVVSARTLYEDVSERPISDVDLRVRPEDLAKVRAVMLHLEAHEQRGTTNQWGTLGFDLRDLLVEFESTIGPPGLATLRVVDLIARARKNESWFGAPIWVPEIHDHALVLMINVFKDKITNAPPWARGDLAKVVRKNDFRDAALAQIVAQANATNIAWVVASWLAKEDQRWRDVLTTLPPPAQPRLAKLLLRQAERGERSLTNALIFRMANDRYLEKGRGVVLAALGTANALRTRLARRP